MVIKVSQNKEFYYWLIAVSIMATFSILFVHVSSAVIQGHILLNINSNPTGADVYIDNIYYGKTPVVATIVEPNPKKIVLELNGYDRWEKEYNPNTDPDKIEVSLNKRIGTISAPAASALIRTETGPGFLGDRLLLLYCVDT
jgi:hypothetical protein